VKLALISDTDEPGQSGVGDYTLLLRDNLASRGISVKIFPLGGTTSSHRKTLPGRLAAFGPDWVSFQFVPYAYAHRGLVTPLTLPWSSLRGRRGTHFMFHEIWIGAHVGASLRDRVMGWLQRCGVQSVIRSLGPCVIHCSNRLYSSLLEHARIPSRLLPLFGNVPVLPMVVDPYKALVESLCPGTDRKDWRVAAFFGTIHSGSSVIQVLRWLQAISQREGRRLLVASLGHCPNASQHFRDWSAAIGGTEQVYFVVKGMMPSHELSAWLGAADCGISTTPYNIIEKSGSAVAFAEHGVPVLVADRGSPVRHANVPLTDLTSRFSLADEITLTDGRQFPSRHPAGSFIDSTVDTLLTDLGEEGTP
jgi:hypothetical protein